MVRNGAPLVLAWLALAACDARRYEIGEAPADPTTPTSAGGGASGAAGAQGGTGGAIGGTGGAIGGSGGAIGGTGGGAVPPPAALTCPIPAASMPDRPLEISSMQAADRVARALIGTRADSQILRDAANVHTNRDVQALARSVIRDDRSAYLSDLLAGRWLELDRLPAAPGAAEVKGQWDEPLRKSMHDESARFVRDVLLADGDTLESLLLASYSYVDDNLAKLYDLPPLGSTQLTRRDFDPPRRSGVLTQPAFLFTNPHASHRGGWLLRAFLCVQIPPEPAGAVDLPSLPPGPMPTTYRQRLESAHDSNPSCAACHRLIDPPGFAFEHYDSLGRWRDTDQGLPIDATGNLMDPVGSGPAMKFDGARQLGEALARSCAVQSCLVQTFMEQMLGGPLRSMDLPSQHEVAAAFAASGFNLRELIVAITASTAFLAP